MSRLIKIDEIDDGMVLAESVMNSYGQVLLKSGSVYNTGMKKVLKTWNIHSLHIHQTGTEDDLEKEFSEEIIEFAKNEFYKRLKWNPKNKFDDEIIQFGIYYTAKKFFSKVK